MLFRFQKMLAIFLQRSNTQFHVFYLFHSQFDEECLPLVFLNHPCHMSLADTVSLVSIILFCLFLDQIVSAFNICCFSFRYSNSFYMGEAVNEEREEDRANQQLLAQRLLRLVEKISNPNHQLVFVFVFKINTYLCCR